MKMKKKDYLSLLLPQLESRKTETYDLIDFLKLKRQEKGITLEVMSNGYLSISYLSRIENHLIEPDEQVMHILCDKVELTYDSVIKERHKNVYNELLLFLLKKDNDKVQALIQEILQDKNYLESERNLILFFESIINHDDNVTSSIIDKLAIDAKVLNEKSRMFFIFCCAMYYFSIGQLNLAYKNVCFLSKSDIEDEFFQNCCYDLAITIFFVTGHFYHVDKYYRLLSNNHEECFHRRLLIHQMQMFYLDSKVHYDDARNKLNQLRGSLHDDDNELIDYFYYIRYRMDFEHNRYEAILKEYDKVSLSKRVLPYYYLAAKEHQNFALSQKIMNDINKYYRRHSNDINPGFCEYILLKESGAMVTDLYRYLKTYLLNTCSIGYQSDLYLEALKEYFELSGILGKYRECMKVFREVVHSASTVTVTCKP